MVFDKQFFKKYQRIILLFANTLIGKYVLRIHGGRSSVGRNKIIEITPNSITWNVEEDLYTTEFRNHNKYSKRLYNALYPVWWMIHQWDMVIANNVIPRLNLGFDTLNASISGSNGDGVIQSENAVWATARNATTGTVDKTSTTAFLVDDKGGAAGAYRVWRIFLPFDTSSLTSGAVISSAVFQLFDHSVSQGTIGHCLVESTQASATDLATGDFDNVGTTELATRLTSFSAGAYNSWTLNSTGLALINKTGHTKLALRGALDFDNTTPTANTYRQWRMSEYTGTANDPVLTITYRVTSIKRFMGLSNRDEELASSILSSDANLQGYWKLESDGTDSSSNSYALTNTGASFVAGKFNNGADLETSESDYLSIAAASCANLQITGTQSWSIWFKPESIGINQRLMGVGNSTPSNGWINFILNGSSNTFRFQYKPTGTPQTAESPIVAVAGNWYHIVGVYNTSDTTLSIYVNGAKTSTTYSEAKGATSGDFSIGRLGAYNADYTDGVIDDVAIWNRALTDSEVLSIYNGSIKKVIGVDALYRELADDVLSSDGNLRGYWRLESDGTDSGSNGYTLTNTGATFVAGKFGNGADLVSASSQYLSRANSTSANLNITGSQTFSAWVKQDSVITAGISITENAADTQAKGLRYNGGFQFQLTGLTTNTSVTSPIVPIVDTWYFLVGVYDSSNSLLKIYVNGIKTQVTASGSAHSITDGSYSIGSIRGITQYFDGIIDDVAVWNRALTDAEIDRLYYTSIKKLAGISNI